MSERPPRAWKSRVRDPLGTRYELGRCGPGRGCYIDAVTQMGVRFRGVNVTDVYARGVNVNLTPLTSNRGALATDARGCSLWRSLLERPPRVWEFWVRDPLGTRYELGRCGPRRGCYSYSIYSIRINTRISKECITIHYCYDILCTALFKALFHVPLLYFEHLPLQRSLHGPAVDKQYKNRRHIGLNALNFNKTASVTAAGNINVHELFYLIGVILMFCFLT